MSKTNNSLQHKQAEFNAAMEVYNKSGSIRVFTWGVACINCLMPVLLLIWGRAGLTQPFLLFVVIAITYLLADFINGIVHMIMDNSSNYSSIMGPFIASFHLHHRTPMYRKRNPVKVFFEEAGSKGWLAIGLITVAGVSYAFEYKILAFGAGLFAYWSCFAELCHYYCHVKTPSAVAFLARLKIMLPKRYHMQHHVRDNYRYAFLNGLTDPVLNLAAKLFFPGYKTTTDLHYKAYQGIDTENRD